MSSIRKFINVITEGPDQIRAAIEKKIEKMLRKEIKKFRKDTKALRKQKQGE